MDDDEEVTDLRELLATVEAYRAVVVEAISATRAVLAAGDLRDAAADVRDVEAAKREHGRDLAVLLDVTADYGLDWPDRRAATLDRERAQQDRVAARLDRWMLADQIRRLVRAGGRGVRQEVLPTLDRGADVFLAPERFETQERGRTGPTRPPSRSTPHTASAGNPERVPRPSPMQFTGAVSVDGAAELISFGAASWEEAVARIDHRYGLDPAFVLRIGSAGDRASSAQPHRTETPSSDD